MAQSDTIYLFHNVISRLVNTFFKYTAVIHLTISIGDCCKI